MKKYLLIDGDSLAYLAMGSDTLEEGMAVIDNIIIDMLYANKCSKYHIYLSRNSFRKDISTIRAYKGNRPKLENILLPSLLKYIEVDHGGVSEYKLEADDLVVYFKTKDTENAIICSIDKDVLGQIAGTHYNYRKKEFVTTSEWDAVEFLWKQTLMGDSGDNIVGVPNIGEKKSTKLLSSCENEEQLINTVLHKYIEYYGKIKGVTNFNENLNLVYLLRTDEDMLNRVDKLPKELSMGKVFNIEKDVTNLI